MIEKIHDDDLLKNISTIHRKSQMFLTPLSEKEGLTAAQVPFILIACESGEILQNKFVEILDMNKSTVTKTIAKLEEQGYLTRKGNPDDNRSFYVIPTEKAYEVHPKIRENGNRWIGILTQELSDVERAIYFDLTERIAKQAGEYAEKEKQSFESKKNNHHTFEKNSKAKA